MFVTNQAGSYHRAASFAEWKASQDGMSGSKLEVSWLYFVEVFMFAHGCPRARRFTSLLLSLALVGLWALQNASQLAAQHLKKPNIVLIFADDLGWQEPGFAGTDYCETPHLDRLAAAGMIFRNAYAAAGNCAPSRACLVSGQYTPRHGVYAVGTTLRGPEGRMRLVPIANAQSIPSTTSTVAEALKGLGYATGMFGKCHLKDSEQGKSERRGFDVVKVSQHGLNSDDPDDPKGIFSISRAACEFIEDHRDEPFFAYLPHYAVHSGLQARSQTLARFQSKKVGTKHDHPLFASCLADLDEGIGMVLSKLEQLKLESNTLVMFTSDNGGTTLSQEPLRGKKGGYYEGGIRVPMVAKWPKVIQAGSTSDEPVINVDLYPTFLAAAGGEKTPEMVLDGESLLPLFRKQHGLKRTSIFWHFPGYLDGPVPRGRDPIFRTRPVTVMRRGDWKLHLYHEEWMLDGGLNAIDTNNSVELYDLATDPGESHNVAQDNRAKRDEMVGEMMAWMQATSAKMPHVANPNWSANPEKKKKNTKE